MPIMDGSAEHFVFMLECAGVEAQAQNRRFIQVLEEFSVRDGDSYITISPANGFTVQTEIAFDNSIISSQAYSFGETSSFKNEISRARTFGFERDAIMLKKMGLAKGASLENAVVIRDDVILNPEGLRYTNEFVRHKLLDLMGDLHLAGHPIMGAVSSFKPGHKLNHKTVSTLLASNAWRYTENAS